MKTVLSHLSRIIIMIAVLTVGLCSSVMNFRFGYQLGSTSFDGFVIGTMSVSLDVVKWFAPVYAALAYSRQAHLRAVSAGLIWAVCVVYSFVAAIGFSALNRETVVSQRSDGNARHQRAIQDRDRALHDLDRLKGTERWVATSGCTNATVPKSVAFCTRVREIETRLKETGSILASTRQTPSDPQTTMLARIGGLPADRIQLGLVVLVAIVSELVSSLGFFAISMPPKPKPKRVQTKKRVRRRSVNGVSRSDRARQSSILIPAAMRRSLLI